MMGDSMTEIGHWSLGNIINHSDAMRIPDRYCTTENSLFLRPQDIGFFFFGGTERDLVRCQLRYPHIHGDLPIVLHLQGDLTRTSADGDVIFIG